MRGPRVPLFYPKWKFKEGPNLEDVFLYCIKFTSTGNQITGVWYVKKKNSRGYYPPRATGRPKRVARLKPVRPGTAFFYVSLERLRSHSLEIRSLTKHMCGGLPVTVKEEHNQTVELPLNPFKKLPLGTRKAIPVRRTRWHKIYVPTRHGGYLNVKVSRGRCKLYYPDQETRMVEESGKKYRAFHGSLWFKIPRDKHGWYYLKVEGIHRYRISVRFYEEGLARKTDHTPHIPWNFYWFPVNEQNTFQPGGVLWKYVDAFGSVPEETDAKQYREQWKRKYELAKAKYQRTLDPQDWTEQWVLEEKLKYAAAEWEKEYHYRPNEHDWAGHCHNVAPASVYIERPRPTEHNGQKFSAEEIAFLSGEWAGNYKVTKKEGGRFALFTLNNGGKVFVPLTWYAYTVLHFFKPSDSVSKQLFIRSVEKQFDIPRLRSQVDRLEEAALYDSSKIEEAVDARDKLERKEKYIEDGVDEAIRDHGGSEQGFRDHVYKEFGPALALLQSFLQKWINEEGFCAVGNLRDGHGTDDPSPVWNHAIFLYRTWMEEAPAQDDEKLVSVVTRLVANTDEIGAVGTMPARPFNSIFGGQRVRVVRGPSNRKTRPPVVRILHGKLQFEDNGNIEADNPNNTWTKVTDETGRKQLYAPSVITIHDKPTQKRGNGRPFGLGNPFVDRRIIKENQIQLADKYK